MKTTVIPFLWNHWRVILYTIASILFTLAILFSSQNEVGVKVFDYIAKTQDQRLESFLNKEAEYVSNSVVEASKRKDVLEGIRNRDNLALIAVMQEEKQKTGLTTFTAVDANGISLSRPLTKSNIGDNVFLTLPAGRVAASGITDAIYGPGRNFPLTLGAGSLVKEQESVEGALFGGYWLDNTYAKLFKLKYLNGFREQEIIFYSKEEGVTGNSIEGAEERNRLRAYITHASTLIQDGRSGDLLNINARDYVVTNHILSSQGDQYGGVLLLTPIPFTLLVRSGIVALLLSLGFLVSLLLLEKITIPQLFRFRKKKLYILVLSLSALVFISMWTGIYSNGKKATIYTHDPTFTIYNSTMKIVPGSGVYATGYPQQVSAMVYSGGEKINAIDMVLRFDPESIQVNSISFERSVCNPDTVLEKEVDNVGGKISVSCLITGDAFEEIRGIVADIDFTPMLPGVSNLSFAEDTHVYAADGLATDVLRLATSASYRAFKEEEIVGAYSEDTVVIPHSLTHDNSSKWYNNKEVVFVWPKVKDVEYVYELSEDDELLIINKESTFSTSLTVTPPADGLYYFKLAAKRDDVLSQVSVFKISIDTTPPSAPRIKVSSARVKKDDIVRFELSSEDTMSGLQKNFYVRIDGGAWLPSSSKLFMPFHEVGDHTLGVRVFDNAENYSDSELVINVSK